MFAGNTAGQYLRPMVVYTSENIYREWVRGGPANTVYECTKNDWFDLRIFEVWFFMQFLPFIENRSGRVVLIGDNPGSHFSPSVIQECVNHDIYFICLPPNATHLCQPPDAAVFRPAKIEWKDILDTWRRESKCTDNLPKTVFPSLLYKLMRRLRSENLVSGFGASGVYPLDRHQVLKRLPNLVTSDEIDNAVFNESVLQILKENCSVGIEKKRVQTKRGRKITPGQRITSLSDDENDAPGSSKKQKGSKKKKTENKNIWQCSDCADEWDEDGDMTNG